MTRDLPWQLRMCPRCPRAMLAQLVVVGDQVFIWFRCKLAHA